MWVAERKGWEGEGCLGLSNKLATLLRQNLLRRAGAGVTFSQGYLSVGLNGFHVRVLDKCHSFF